MVCSTSNSTMNLFFYVGWGMVSSVEPCHLSPLMHPSAAPLPQNMPGNEIPHPEPMLYVYRRNPSPDGDAYIAIALGFDPSYGLIASQTPSPDPGETLDNDPRFNVDVPGAKPYAVAEVAPFELTSRVNGHDMVAPFRPDVPVA